MAYIKVTDEMYEAAKKAIAAHNKYLREFPNLDSDSLEWMCKVFNSIQREATINVVDFSINNLGGFLVTIQYGIRKSLLLIDQNGIEISDCRGEELVLRKRFTKRKKIENIIKEIKSQF